MTDEMLLESWHEQLTKWHSNLSQRPKPVTALCRKGVPEPLRGEVWQLLAGVGDSKEMLENYRVLLSKVSFRKPRVCKGLQVHANIYFWFNFFKTLFYIFVNTFLGINNNILLCMHVCVFY